MCKVAACTLMGMGGSWLLGGDCRASPGIWPSRRALHSEGELSWPGWNPGSSSASLPVLVFSLDILLPVCSPSPPAHSPVFASSLGFGGAL